MRLLEINEVKNNENFEFGESILKKPYPVQFFSHWLRISFGNVFNVAADSFQCFPFRISALQIDTSM